MNEYATVDIESLRYRDPAYASPDRSRSYHDPENLSILYHQLELNQDEIADFYGVDQSTISRAMDEAGVEARPPIDVRQKTEEGY